MNEQAPVTAKEAFEQALPAILSGDLADLLGRCADDVIFEFPFAPDGRPRRLEGREQVREYLDAVNSRLKIEGLTSLELHETTDPAVVIAEMSMNVALGDGPTREASYVEVVTVCDGQIARLREYWSPLALAN
jgi:ketosteroid isomerase-like protein